MENNMVVNSRGSLARRKQKEKEMGIKEPELVTPRPPSILVSTGEPTEAPFEETAKAQRQKGVAPDEGRTAEQFQQQQALAKQPTPDFQIPSQKERMEVSTTPVIAQAEALAKAEADQRLINKISRGEATPEEIQKATGRFNLTDFDLAVIKSGDVQINALNSKIDSLQAFLPREARKFVPLFSAPSKEVEENLELLKKTRDALFTNYEMLQNGIAIEDNRRQVRENEQSILKYQSIIKLMTIQSGALQSNPEQVTSIEKDVQAILQEINLKRAEFGLLGINI